MARYWVMVCAGPAMARYWVMVCARPDKALSRAGYG